MITLKKNSDKDFLILNLTDTQLVTEDWEKNSINKNVLYYTVDKLIERVKPDLITVSGDIADRGQIPVYEKFTELIDSYNIPWAPIWGNHDNEYAEKHLDKVADIFLSSKNIVFEKGSPDMGMGNYVINVEENGKTVFGLFMLDAHDKIKITKENGEEKRVYAKIFPCQLEWYEEQIKALNKNGCKETAIITHIPFYGYRKAFEEAWNKDIDEKSLTGADSSRKDLWNDGYKDCSFGIKMMPVCSHPYDDGVFEAIKRLNSTKTVLCGHDHYNNCITVYDGIKLGYSLKTGAGAMRQKGLNGGTVIRVGSNGVKDVYHENIDVSHFFAEIERRYREEQAAKNQSNV
jgi:hypothetical protein